MTMSNTYRDRKVNKKQRRCIAIIEKDCDVKSSEDPTEFVSILNAGLATGLSEELIIETTSKHGELVQVIMLPGKSFCFLQCSTIADAENIYNNLNNQANIGQNGAVIYVGFFEKLPSCASNMWLKQMPKDLLYLPNFVTCDEEQEILNVLDLNKTNTVDAESSEGALKHRRVVHYGYGFLYGVNNVDPQKPLPQGIPNVCNKLWPRLVDELKKRGIELNTWNDPDQLTVNYYEPGQGIPQHVDTHSAFLEPILSLSLVGDTVMDFRRSNERIPILLESRSMLVMCGESRYDWTHGITPRYQDVIPTKTGTLTTQRRTKRVSLTFRRLRRAACDCNYPTMCDTRLEHRVKAAKPQLEEVAAQLEQLNVHKIYDEIASHFSETRHSPWPQVAEFLQSFPIGAVLVDIGCGNGKYLQCNKSTLNIGCDRSQGLLKICAQRGNSSFQCDCLNVPLRTACVDGCISIAVIHHLATIERRLQALNEMARVLRTGGRALVYVWAKNQQENEKKSSYLRQNKAINKQKITEDEQRQQTLQASLVSQESSTAVALPIHTNRTAFQHQDVLVPWKLKNGGQQQENKLESTFLRYYHVFEQGELEELLTKVVNVKLLRSYYDQGNHCIIFQKL